MSRRKWAETAFICVTVWMVVLVTKGFEICTVALLASIYHRLLYWEEGGLE